MKVPVPLFLALGPVASVGAFVVAFVPVADAAPAATATATDAPAMVTLVRGPVTLVQGGKSTAAPAAPFLLTAGQTLDLGAGAHVVFLRQGGAFTVDGPKKVDPTSFSSAPVGGDQVGVLLQRRTSLASAGASRGAGVVLTRPVPRAPMLALRDIRWRCDACGPQPVAVVDLRADTTVWTGRGEGSVTYDGLALAPGTYVVRVGVEEFALRVTPRDEADAAIASAHADQVADPADRAATVAAALLLAGYPTDALTALEGAGLTELVGGYEKLAGVAP
ncbi:MAG: hypothetical protein Q8P41_15230 [Pseudomonadota bacterium]|nr:hypothetical protein [Pseudomonadota bacterium]